ENCYSEAKVNGNDYVGGLVGVVYSDNSKTTSITHSYFSGTVQFGEGKENNGGLFGGYDDSSNEKIDIVDSFYLKVDDDYGFTEGTAISESDMKKISTFTLSPEEGFIEKKAWSISPTESSDYVWYIDEDVTYPMLSTLYIPTNNSGSSGGSDFGQAKVIKLIDEIPDLKDNTIQDASEMPTNIDDVKSVGTSNAYGAETNESESNQNLYLLLGVGFILVIGGVAYLVLKKR
ncbi:hypothetical protein LJC08_05505, partial [Methanimicrococcus sp. OttesenSCG-928-J09]|nr:hypothetical protein [Methanimicrococcus sp. OttesenSCG-928-J09]